MNRKCIIEIVIVTFTQLSLYEQDITRYNTCRSQHLIQLSETQLLRIHNNVINNGTFWTILSFWPTKTYRVHKITRHHKDITIQLKCQADVISISFHTLKLTNTAHYNTTYRPPHVNWCYQSSFEKKDNKLLRIIMQNCQGQLILSMESIFEKIYIAFYFPCTLIFQHCSSC